MNRPATPLPLRSAACLLFTLVLMGCDPNAGFIGSWSGATTLNSGSRTVAKTGVVSIGASTPGVLVTIQMPLPTLDSPVLSTACELPASPASAETLDLSAHDCPAVALGSGCSLTLKVATERGTLQPPGTLKISGSGTVVGTGCGTTGSSTESFSFETIANK